MCSRDRGAFEGWDVGRHGTSRVFPADFGKADQERARGSGGLDELP